MLHIISNERDLRQFRTAPLPKFRAAQAGQGFRGVRPRLAGLIYPLPPLCLPWVNSFAVIFCRHRFGMAQKYHFLF